MVHHLGDAGILQRIELISVIQLLVADGAHPLDVVPLLAPVHPTLQIALDLFGHRYAVSFILCGLVVERKFSFLFLFLVMFVGFAVGGASHGRELALHEITLRWQLVIILGAIDWQLRVHGLEWASLRRRLDREYLIYVHNIRIRFQIV